MDKLTQTVSKRTQISINPESDVSNTLKKKKLFHLKYGIPEISEPANGDVHHNVNFTSSPQQQSIDNRIVAQMNRPGTSSNLTSSCTENPKRLINKRNAKKKDIGIQVNLSLDNPTLDENITPDLFTLRGADITKNSQLYDHRRSSNKQNPFKALFPISTANQHYQYATCSIPNTGNSGQSITLNNVKSTTNQEHSPRIESTDAFHVTKNNPQNGPIAYVSDTIGNSGLYDHGNLFINRNPSTTANQEPSPQAESLGALSIIVNIPQTVAATYCPVITENSGLDGYNNFSDNTNLLTTKSPIINNTQPNQNASLSFPITENPERLITLLNLRRASSVPEPNPRAESSDATPVIENNSQNNNAAFDSEISENSDSDDDNICINNPNPLLIIPSFSNNTQPYQIPQYAQTNHSNILPLIYGYNYPISQNSLIEVTYSNSTENSPYLSYTQTPSYSLSVDTPKPTSMYSSALSVPNIYTLIGQNQTIPSLVINTGGPSTISTSTLYNRPINFYSQVPTGLHNPPESTIYIMCKCCNFNCNNAEIYKCQICFKVGYCSIVCQATHWNFHKNECCSLRVHHQHHY